MKKEMKKVGKELESARKEVSMMNNIGNTTSSVFDSIEKLIGKKHRKLTMGQKAADFLTKWAGSWVFIIGFFIFLGLWIATNIYAWLNQWDPYPFILLNLVLSCLAAIQAPIILMSQNRSSQRDRLKAEFDYRINKKAEKEIREIKQILLRKLK